MLKTQRPTLKNSEGGLSNTTYEHPAFGVMRISNPQGGNVHLFGSDAVHDSRIRIEISPATWDRHLSTDWIHGSQRPIVAVEMSHAQFVSAIQSSGKGEGTPITLVIAPVDRTIERVVGIEPLESSHEMVKKEMVDELRKSMESAQSALKKLKDSFENKSGAKVLREELSNLERSLSKIPTSLEFSLDMAQEAIDKKKHDAQIEVDAMIENKVRRIGLEAIGKGGSNLFIDEKVIGVNDPTD